VFANLHQAQTRNSANRLLRHLTLASYYLKSLAFRRVVVITKHSKSQRRCAFCGVAGNISKEHVWPRWLRQLAPDVDKSRFTHSAGFGWSEPSAFREYQTDTVHQPGSVFNMVAREVCAECNGGWMSRLERSAQPILLRLISVASEESADTLVPGEAAVLAVWAIKTAWMREFTAPGNHTATREMRAALRSRLEPPDFSRVWLARHSGQINFDARQARIGIGQTARWDDPDDRTAQFTALTFSGLCLLSYTVDGGGVQPPTRDPRQWVELWPVANKLTFPPTVPVRDIDVTMTVAQHTPWLKLPPGLAFRRAEASPRITRRN
jgi:hypothetical protein